MKNHHKKSSEYRENINKIENSKNGILLSIIFSIVSLFFVFTFFVFTFIPYNQMKLWKIGINEVVEKGNDKAFPNDPFIYEAYNESIQGNIRMATFSNIFNQYVRGTRSGETPLYDIALNREKEWIDAHPYRYDNLLSIAKGFEYKANLTGNKSFYDKAEEYYQKALALCPDRQDLLYAYAEHLSNIGKKKEATDLLEKMIKQSPNLAQTKYYYGMVLAAGEKTDYDRALITLEDAFDTGRVTADPMVVKTVYEHFFVYYYQNKNVKSFRRVVRRLLWVDGTQHDVYEGISNYIDQYKSIPLLNLHT